MSDFTEGAKKAAKEAGEYASQFFTTSKNEFSILALKNRLDTKMKQLGYLCYSQSLRDAPDYSSQEIIEKKAEIEEIYDKLSACEEQKNESRASVRCRNCGTYNPAGSYACSACGNRMPK